MSENTENIESVSDEVVAIEKVFTQEETKLFRTKALLFQLTGEALRAKVEHAPSVPVFSGEKLIGYASTWQDGPRVSAELVIDYSTPERLEIENGGALYAAPQVEFYQMVETSPYSMQWIPTVIRVLQIKIVNKKLFEGMEPIGKIL